MFHSVRGRKIDVTCTEDLIKKKLKLLTRSFKQFALNQEVIIIERKILWFCPVVHS